MEQIKKFARSNPPVRDQNALARCRCPDIDCHRVYARDIPRSCRLPPPHLRTNAASPRTYTCGRHHVCITRTLIFTIRFLSLRPLPLFLRPSLSDSHTCDPLRVCRGARAATASIIIAIAETMQRQARRGRERRSIPLSRAASRYLARARLRDARSYLANQFRPARSEKRSLTRPLAHPLPLPLLRRSKLSLPRRGGNYRSEGSIDRHAYPADAR